MFAHQLARHQTDKTQACKVLTVEVKMLRSYSVRMLSIGGLFYAFNGLHFFHHSKFIGLDVRVMNYISE